MGFSPQEVDSMSLWQFIACLDGWKASRGIEEKLDPPSTEEFHDMVSRLS